MKACKEFNNKNAAHLRASASYFVHHVSSLRNEHFPEKILHFLSHALRGVEDNDDEENNGRSGREREQRETALVSDRVARSDRAFTRSFKDDKHDERYRSNEDENGALLKRSDASALLKNVPQNDENNKKTYCAKVANVGEWFFGETACEYAQMEMDFAHSFDACDEGDEASGWWFGRRRKTRRKEAKAWVPDEGLMDACQFFRFASATISTSRSSFSSSTSLDVDAKLIARRHGTFGRKEDILYKQKKKKKLKKKFEMKTRKTISRFNE